MITHGAAAAELMEAEALGGTFLGVCRIVTQPCSIDLLLPVVEHLGEVGERVLDRTALKVGGLADTDPQASARDLIARARNKRKRPAREAAGGTDGDGGS